jgi:hypothetical protein
VRVQLFSAIDFAVPAFGDAVQLAVDAGLSAAAILDASGKLLAVAGALDDDEARALAAHATHQLRAPDLLERMHENEMIKAWFGERDVRIGIASKCVFMIVVLPRDPATVSRAAVEELRADIAHALNRANTRLLPPPSSGSSSSGPGELPAVELGVTVRRRDPN